MKTKFNLVWFGLVYNPGQTLNLHPELAHLAEDTLTVKLMTIVKKRKENLKSQYDSL